jgi:hypothetical protein
MLLPVLQYRLLLYGVPATLWVIASFSQIRFLMSLPNSCVKSAHQSKRFLSDHTIPYSHPHPHNWLRVVIALEILLLHGAPGEGS